MRTLVESLKRLYAAGKTDEEKIREMATDGKSVPKKRNTSSERRSDGDCIPYHCRSWIYCVCIFL